MSGEKCCCCFPLDCGMKTLGVFTVLGTIAFMIQCFMIEELWSLWSPLIAAYGIMSLIWLFALISPTESNRKMTLIAWLILIVGCARVYYLWVILNGEALERFCDE